MLYLAMIFPWNDNFDTGIEVIDKQHRKLVDLLNVLAGHLAYGADAPGLTRVFNELADYAEYHFKTEETIWKQYFPEDELSVEHVKAHQDFVAEILKIKADLDKLGDAQIIDEMIAFLTHWLAFHILESDKYLAKIVLALQRGISLSDAKKQASIEMSGGMRVLIETILKMYDSLSSRTLDLMREISERQRAEQNLRLSKNVIDSTLEAIFITDADYRIIDTNPAFCHDVKRQHQDLIGMPIMEVMPNLFSHDKNNEIMKAAIEGGHWAGEIISRDANNKMEATWLTLSAIKDDQGTITQFVGLLSSITQLLERHNGLVEAANHDALTGLPNRRLLQDRLDRAITRSDRNGHLLAVCFLDLDGFKKVNDTLGHEAGDQVLRVVATRLSKVLRGDDTVARLGGDEFVLLLSDIEGEGEDEKDITPLLTRILTDIAQPVLIQGEPVRVTVSMGVTLYPHDKSTPESLLIHADEAMYSAKKSGKSQFHFYS